MCGLTSKINWKLTFYIFFISSTGVIGVRAVQHLSLLGGQHLQRDDVFQWFSNACWLSKLPTQLRAAAVFQALCWPLWPAQIHPFSGKPTFIKVQCLFSNNPNQVINMCAHVCVFVCACVCVWTHTFQTKVTSVTQRSDFSVSGQWDIVTVNKDQEEERHVFDAVMVCSGHYTKPTLPLSDFPGLWRKISIFLGALQKLMAEYSVSVLLHSFLSESVSIDL